MNNQSTPSITVNLSPMLVRHSSGQQTFSVEANSVREALEQLIKQTPPLKDVVLRAESTRNSFINIYLNDHDIRSLDGLDTPCPQGAVITLLTAVAGG
jgi:sulfur-carrier protein